MRIIVAMALCLGAGLLYGGPPSWRIGVVVGLGYLAGCVQWMGKKI